ncbi:hypothetical protein [Desulfosoma caldarium]|uniref:Uncharacterized protein n=1 Tax=Desulfosoma caldarium TaxID=610254 RepID=A0A3N1UMB2_9BACT|nr:hypothetical protein [Desulfosoma caldarium]ROQ90878.1 hypothetical protein EDC27_2134 [Desulfosoma caldarium]
MTIKDTNESPFFVKRCGMARVYAPAANRETPKKNPCPDCHFCLQCSEARCQTCRRTACGGKRLSFAEQIALYERLNARDRSETPR